MYHPHIFTHVDGHFVASLFSRAAVLLLFPPKHHSCFHVFSLAKGSVHIPPVKNRKFCFPMSYENERQKMEIIKFEFRFFNVAGEQKTKMEVRIPFFNETVKRKTKIEVRIPFFLCCIKTENESCNSVFPCRMKTVGTKVNAFLSLNTSCYNL